MRRRAGHRVRDVDEERPRRDSRSMNAIASSVQRFTRIVAIHRRLDHLLVAHQRQLGPGLGSCPSSCRRCRECRRTRRSLAASAGTPADRRGAICRRCRSRSPPVFSTSAIVCFVGVQALGVDRPQHRAVAAADVHVDAARIAAGHQRRAAGRADAAGDVEAGELRPLGGQAIDVRRAVELRAEAADVAVAEVIDEEQDDVGRTFGSFCGPQGQRN